MTTPILITLLFVLLAVSLPLLMGLLLLWLSHVFFEIVIPWFTDLKDQIKYSRRLRKNRRKHQIK